MCFGGRDKTNGEAARSREIDRGIRQDEKRKQKEVKLLLLGKRQLKCRGWCFLYCRDCHDCTWHPNVHRVTIYEPIERNSALTL